MTGFPTITVGFSVIRSRSCSSVIEFTSRSILASAKCQVNTAHQITASENTPIAIASP